MTTRIIKYNQTALSSNGMEVIYVEREPYPQFNEYLEEHKDELCADFEEIGYRFFYLTPLSVHIAEEVVRYFEPASFRCIHKETIPGFNLPDYVRYILDDEKDVYGPCLLYGFRSNGECRCAYLNPDNVPENEIRDAISTIKLEKQERITQKALFDVRRLPDVSIPGIDELSRGEQNEPADDRFSTEVFAAIKEIRKYAKFMEEHGVYLSVLGSTVSVHGMLSSLVINRDYSILLPDYHISFKLEPLPMSVYLLFLNHPEGIMFKDLPLYRDELSKIYEKMTGRSDPSVITRSIEDLTDPMKNSINEKCSIIRREFVKRFEESLAVNYIITGKKGEPKKILIPRNKVERFYY